RADQMAVYVGYWNALECLVDAANMLVPRPRLPRDEKAHLIAQRITECGGTLTATQLVDLYREVVDPGFKASASHAMHALLGDDATRYIGEAFASQPRDHSLYAIRNSINHGTIDINDPESGMLVEARFRELFLLVHMMFDGILRLHLDRMRASLP